MSTFRHLVAQFGLVVGTVQGPADAHGGWQPKTSYTANAVEVGGTVVLPVNGHDSKGTSFSVQHSMSSQDGPTVRAVVCDVCYSWRRVVLSMMPWVNRTMCSTR